MVCFMKNYTVIRLIKENIKLFIAVGTACRLQVKKLTFSIRWNRPSGGINGIPAANCFIGKLLTFQLFNILFNLYLAHIIWAISYESYESYGMTRSTTILRFELLTISFWLICLKTYFHFQIFLQKLYLLQNWSIVEENHGLSK